MLGDEQLTAGTRLAAAGIDRALELLSDELSLSAEDIVRVPALFTRLDVPGYPRQDVVANHLPAVANGVSTGTSTFLAPVTHGPADATGEDVCQRATEEAMATIGARVVWVEEWDYARGRHRGRREPLRHERPARPLRGRALVARIPMTADRYHGRKQMMWTFSQPVVSIEEWSACAAPARPRTPRTAMESAAMAVRICISASMLRIN